ncbi:MAG: N(4)-(beta-N-acetylglucosaminyl)-L-asparaginase [Verrucomicrobia bacterium]|nr:N(4)-(beta-N-acetylglucosaminyl)-L-asparaginase [Verrucomicrobiota bacterium]
MNSNPTSFPRRKFFQTGLALGAAGLAASAARISAQEKAPLKGRPVAISSANGLRATDKAMELIKSGADTLDAAIAGVNIVEEDPNDMSVGYGGLPNERGVVELDACVMHGPTYRAGAVAALQNIKTPSKVAKEIMERTNHLLMVGAGALEFAKLVGFKEENLLTEPAREAWLKWRSNLNKEDNWLGDDDRHAGFFERPTGTINCCTFNEKGDLSGCTSTSGLAFKIPGRVGDSPIIGAGLYVDNAVGACGSTGFGEAVILSSGSRTVVENMRHGMKPETAILDVLRRICEQTVAKRLLRARGKPKFDVNFYAINKAGEYAGGAIYKGGKYAVHDGTKNLLRDSVYVHDDAK